MSKRYALIVVPVIAVVLGSCGDRDREGVASQSPPTTPTRNIPSMKYAKVSVANEKGFAKVSLGQGETYAEGVIDAGGKEVIHPNPQILVNAITDDIALIQRGRDFLFVNLEQQRRAPATFDHAKAYSFAEPYSDGLAMVQLDDRYSYIDTQGQSCFGTTYDFAESFHQNRAYVTQGDHKRIIDTKGHVVAELTHDQVSPQSPWCWQVTRIEGEKYWSGFVDLNGKEISPLIYDEVGYYDADVKRIRVGRGDKYGFLDEHAQVAIPVQYEQAEIFSQGKARVMLRGRSFFIDPIGKEVSE